MVDSYYPWGGTFTECDSESCVAVVLLKTDYSPPSSVAVYGPLKTENIGIEKIVANVISNPHIRYVVVCGEEIRGHRSGLSLLMLHSYGVNNENKIIKAPGAIPYIENLDEEAIKRFQDQIIKIVDLIDVTDKKVIDNIINDLIRRNHKPFGKPYIAIRIKPQSHAAIKDKRALHSKIMVDYMGKIEKRGG